MVFDAKFLVIKIVNFLWLPGLTLTEHLNQLFLFIFAELRGTSVPEVRRELSEIPSVPASCPPTTCGLRLSDASNCLFERIAGVEIFDKREAADGLRIVRLREQSIKILLAEMSNNLFPPISTHRETLSSIRITSLEYYADRRERPSVSRRQRGSWISTDQRRLQGISKGGCRQS